MEIHGTHIIYCYTGLKKQNHTPYPLQDFQISREKQIKNVNETKFSMFLIDSSRGLIITNQNLYNNFN